MLYLETKDFQGREGTIRIVNMFGQVLKNVDVDPQSDAAISIPLNQMDNGMYSLIVKVKGQPIQTELFLIEKGY